MRIKQLSIGIFTVIFVLFASISLLAYNKTDSVNILCFDGSYAEEYAKEHGLKYEVLADSEAYLGIMNLENFEYNTENGEGKIVSYTGTSEKIAIPENINGYHITAVAASAFENAANLQAIYLPKSVKTFEPEALEGVTLYLYEDSELYKMLSANEDSPLSYETIADSYYVDFYSANIPFAYDNISDTTVEITRYTAELKTVIVPETIDGRTVTGISFDVLSDGIRTLCIPASVTNIESDLYSVRYDTTFLFGLLIALGGLILASVCTLAVKADTKEKTFLRIPQIRIAYTTVLLSLLVAVLYLYVAIIPKWILWVALAIMAAVIILRLLKAEAAASGIEKLDKTVRMQTDFIKQLTADAEVLTSLTAEQTLQAEIRKVYEALCYSDPVSTEAVMGINEQIGKECDAFKNAVTANDPEQTQAIVSSLLSLIEQRNVQCQQSK